MTLNLIDIASYQNGINAGSIAGDGVIVKATEGINYINPAYSTQIHQADNAGKLLGVYHFLRTDSDVKSQADYFLTTVKPYIGKAVLFLDFENTTGSTIQNQNGVNLAKQWLDYVYSKTGVRPIIYMSLSVENNLNWSSVVGANYGLWVAQYNNNNLVNGYQPRKIYGATKYWKATALFQYTSSGRLPGYSGNLDFDVFYGDTKAWDAYAKSTAKPVTPSKPVVKPMPSTPAYNTAGKTLESMANDVMAGKVGSGATRTKLLGKYATAVQALVNYKMKAVSATSLNNTLASEVKKGVFGAGDTRKKQLGSYYNAVQAVINKSIITHTYYTVRSGDSFWSIAKKYGINMNKLASQNKLTIKSVIYPGQRLLIR